MCDGRQMEHPTCGGAPWHDCTVEDPTTDPQQREVCHQRLPVVLEKVARECFQRADDVAPLTPEARRRGRTGFCDVTDEAVSDCTFGIKGSWGRVPSLAACAARCACCARCVAAVSYSKDTLSLSADTHAPCTAGARPCPTPSRTTTAPSSPPATWRRYAPCRRCQRPTARRTTPCCWVPTGRAWGPYSTLQGIYYTNQSYHIDLLILCPETDKAHRGEEGPLQIGPHKTQKRSNGVSANSTQTPH